jgi:hypothetical protein
VLVAVEVVLVLILEALVLLHSQVVLVWRMG